MPSFWLLRLWVIKMLDPIYLLSVIKSLERYIYVAWLARQFGRRER